MRILKPVVHETIWGGSKLTPYSGCDCVKIGHLYSFIDTEPMRSVIACGPDAGKDLHQWFLENRNRYGLGRYDELPILGALVDASNTLSIQVHPDDRMARELAGKPFGKNESFYTLEAPTSGWMYNGCKAQSAEEMNSKLESGRIGETLDTMPCHAGDYVYIHSGVLHAATAGSLHFEIEENCEITYRLYDFERRDHHGHLRPLQIDNALRCLDVTKKSQARTYGEYPIEERMYSTQLIRQRDGFANSGDIFAFAVMLKGDREYDGYRVTPGTAILLDSDESLDVSGGEFMICKPKP